jgi:hypothetical protein
MSEDDSSKLGFSAGRRWAVGFNAVVGAMALLAILAMVNYVAAGHVKRFEWERQSPFKLSKQTLSVLAQLTNKVTITVCFDPGDEQDIYELTTGLLKEYKNANPRFITVENLDYTRFPGQAKVLRDRLHLEVLKENDFVAIEDKTNGHSKVFYSKQLIDYDFNDVIAGKSKIVRRKDFKGEIYFTSAIFAVSNPRDLKTYFIGGHGEGDPGDPNDRSASSRKLDSLGYSKLADILTDEVNSGWQRLLLRGTNTIPADCQLLIIGGPYKAQFDTNEVAKIEAYLAQGGRLLLMLDRDCGLRPLMNRWGFDVASEPVVEDQQFRIYGDTQFLAAHMNVHPTTDALNRENLALLMVRPHPISLAPKQPGAPEVTWLVASSEMATVGKQKGAFPLICAVKQGVVKETRILVAGDPYFLDDENIDRGVANHYFAGLVLNWLLERPEVLLSNLGPSPIKEYKLTLTDRQTSQLRWLFLAAMPGSVLFLGWLVWLRRRN